MLGKNKSSVSFEANAYKIICKDCEIVYRSETDRNTRIKEHRHAIKGGNDNLVLLRHV